MPLEILGALVVFGISGVVLLVHLLRMSPRKVFADEADARAAFSADYPEAAVEHLAMSDDGRAAVLATNRGPAAVTVVGDGTLTRLFAGGDIRRIEERTGRLRIVLDDFGAPNLTLAFAEPERRAEAKTILETVT